MVSEIESGLRAGNPLENELSGGLIHLNLQTKLLAYDETYVETLRARSVGGVLRATAGRLHPPHIGAGAILRSMGLRPFLGQRAP